MFNKNQLFTGLGIGLVIIAIIAGIFGGGSGFQGNVTDIPGADEVQNADSETEAETCEIKTDLKSLVDAINTASQEVTAINIESDSQIEGLENIASGVATILKSLDSEPCPEITEEIEYSSLGLEIETQPELVDFINEAIDEINDTCDDCGLETISSFEPVYSCNSGRNYDEDTQSCKDPEATSCTALNIYTAASAANKILDDYKSNPADFNIVSKNLLQQELDKIGSAGRYNLDNFNYLNEAEALSIELVALVTGIKNLEPACSQLNSIQEVEITNRITPNAETPDNTTQINNALNGVISCPANSVLDTDTQECFCPTSDDYISETETCALNTTVNDVPLTEEVLFCADGSATFDLRECDEIANAIDEEDTDPEFDPADIDMNVDPNEINPNEEIINDFPMDGFTDTNIEDEMNNETDDDLEIPDTNAEASTSTPSLTSNTNANVMAAGQVQGNTGPGLGLTILLSSLIIAGLVRMKKI